MCGYFFVPARVLCAEEVSWRFCIKRISEGAAFEARPFDEGMDSDYSREEEGVGTMLADTELIEWLLFESGASTKELVAGTTIGASTIKDLKAKRAQINGMRLKNAIVLTEYAKALKQAQKPS